MVLVNRLDRASEVALTAMIHDLGLLVDVVDDTGEPFGEFDATALLEGNQKPFSVRLDKEPVGQLHQVAARAGDTSIEWRFQLINDAIEEIARFYANSDIATPVFQVSKMFQGQRPIYMCSWDGEGVLPPKEATPWFDRSVRVRIFCIFDHWPSEEESIRAFKLVRAYWQLGTGLLSPSYSCVDCGKPTYWLENASDAPDKEERFHWLDLLQAQKCGCRLTSIDEKMGR